MKAPGIAAHDIDRARAAADIEVFASGIEVDVIRVAAGIGARDYRTRIGVKQGQF